jgi:hypothetical protein
LHIFTDMKHLTILFSIFLPLLGTSQIVLDQGDYLRYGNEYYRGGNYYDLDTIGLEESSGPNQVWDFSWIEPVTEDTLKVFKADLTPYFNDFPASDFGITSNQNNYFYEQITDEGIKILGKAIRDNFNNVDNLYNYISEDVSLKLPLAYQDTFSFKWNYRIQYPAFFPGSDSIRNYNRSEFYVEADASGSIILPLGTFEVLRLKQTAITTDTVFIYNEPGPWGPNNIYKDTLISYIFFPKYIGTKALSITKGINLNSGQFNWLLGYDIDESGINKLSDFKSNVFPLPANRFIRVECEENASYIITNLTGEILIKGEILRGGNSIQLPIASSGLYILKLQGEKSGKINFHKLIISQN